MMSPDLATDSDALLAISTLGEGVLVKVIVNVLVAVKVDVKV